MGKKNLSVTLYLSELIYDVQNKTYLTGRSRNNGKNYEQVANMQANNDDEDENQIVRSIQSAYGTLKTKLSEYIDEDNTTTSDKLMDTTSNIIITLKMPSNYNQATTDTVSASLHDYIVNSAIGDWFVITNKDDAENYVKLAIVNLEQIREAINKRVRPSRAVVS